jgi:diguanylate cyclase (GGDEF)-like protein
VCSGDKLAAIVEAVRVIGSSLDYSEVLQSVAEVAGKAFDSPECVVWEYAADGDAEILRAFYERDPQPGLAESIVGRRYPLVRLGDYGARMKAGEVQELRCSDARVHPDLRRTMTEWDERTLLSIPLLTPDEILGEMVLIETERERRFAAEELDVAVALGEIAAVALANARLHAQVARQAAIRRDLLGVSEKLLGRLDEDDVLASIAASLADLVGYDSMALGVTSDRAGAEVRIAVGTGTAELMLAGQPCGAAEQDDRHSLVVPLPGGDDAAVLTLVRDDGEAYTEDDRETVRTFASLAAVALENARLYQIAQERAVHDGLTGLYNHRTFFERLRSELARAARSGYAVSVLLLDIDDFKRLNDVHGHPAGDDILVAVGRALRMCVRDDVDLAARYGGEEFAVILPDADAEAPTAAGDVAERIRAAVAEETAATHSAAGAALAVTVSVGVAVFPAAGTTPDELVAAADRALYAAKAAGKDRVAAAPAVST